MAAYPSTPASFTTKQDYTEQVLAAHINALQDEVVAIQSALGLMPQGTATTARARLDALTASLASETTDRIAADARSSVGVTRSTTQSIANATWVPLDMTVFGTHNEATPATPLYSSVTPSGQARRSRINITLPSAAMVAYIISAAVTFGLNNTGIRGIRVQTAGGSTVQQFLIDASITGSDSLSLTTMALHDYQAGYFYEVQVYQTSGGALNLYANSASTPNSISAMAIQAG